MQDGAIKLFGMSMPHLSKQGKNDPKGNSEINRAIIRTTGPGGKAASTSLSKGGTTKRSSTSQAAANQDLGTPGVLRARLPAFASGVGLCLPETYWRDSSLEQLCVQTTAPAGPEARYQAKGDYFEA